MTLHHSPWLPVATCALAIACGNNVPPNAEAGDSATGSTSITTASATEPEHPTTGGATGDPTGGAGTASHSEATGDPPADTTATDPDATSTTSTTTSTTPGETSSGDPEDTGETTRVSSTMPIEPCQIETTPVYPIPPTVLFLLDKSGSMGNLPNYLWDHDNDSQTPKVTRWSSLHAVVESMVTKFNDTVEFGVKLYPKIDATPFKATGACDVDDGVEVEPAPMNAVNVLNGIPPANFDVLGGTPMESGVKEAFDYLTALDPDDQKFIVMIADGDISKTCEDQNILEAVAWTDIALQDYGIATYVVGIAIDDPASHDQLVQMAEAGGKPNPAGPNPYYSTQNQIQLDDAIQKIVDDTLSCTITVDPTPSEPGLFEVWIDDDEIPEVADCDGDGFVWTTPYSEIQLCGDACAKLKSTGNVEARYYCVAG